jgi:hypothetical protein
MATILTKMLLIGLKDTAPDKLNGCLLIVARKSSQ